MEFVLNKIKEDIEYLTLQGKKVERIKMDSKIFDNLSKENTELTDVEVSGDSVTVFGIPIEANENVEKFEYILGKAT